MSAGCVLDLVVKTVGATVPVISTVVPVDSIALVGPVVDEGTSGLVVPCSPQSLIREILSELIRPNWGGGVGLHH